MNNYQLHIPLITVICEVPPLQVTRAWTTPLIAANQVKREATIEFLTGYPTLNREIKHYNQEN